MIYLDANLFIYSAIYSDERGKSAQKTLQNILTSSEPACTATLTWDEVVYVVKKHRNLKQAIEIGRSMMNMKNLSLINVTPEILKKAEDIMTKYKIEPRDAIHAACCIQQNATSIISEDSDFDQIQEFKREWVF